MNVRKNFITHAIVCCVGLTWCTVSITMLPPAQPDAARVRNRRYLSTESSVRAEINYRLTNPTTPTDQFIPADIHQQQANILFMSIQNDATTRVHNALNALGGINAPDPQGRTQLMLAARAGEFAVVRALLAANANPNIIDGGGRNAQSHVCGDLANAMRASGGQAVRGGRGEQSILRLANHIAIALQGRESRINDQGQTVIDDVQVANTQP